MSMEWMAWTPVTACFFIFIILMLIGMTVWHQISPTFESKGFLPMKTTRGDRLFIGLLGSAYIYLIWIIITEISLWFVMPIALLYIFIVMKFG